MKQTNSFLKSLLLICCLGMSFFTFANNTIEVDSSQIVKGCTDSKALNFNPSANFNDGSCDYPLDTTKIVGCMDTMALNYNPYATVAGFCQYKDTTKVDILGCTNPNAFNYNPYATKDDSTCKFSLDTNIVFGCTDPGSLNFNPSATKNDGSCMYAYDTTKVVNIYGCTDPLAYNFNGYANINDNSCLYKQVQINTQIVIVKSELKDTVGAVVFNNCILNYNLPIQNAEIENIDYIGNDSVSVTWGIYQSDSKKTVVTKYRVQTTGKQLFILTISCNGTPNSRIAGNPIPKFNTFGDVAEVLTITGIENKALAAFTLFPIPTDNIIHFNTTETGILSISNLLGENVLTVNLSGLYGEFSLADLASGAYVYKFTGKSGQKVGKLIKQ